MAYCDQDNILEQMDEDVLIQLTDDDDAGTVDEDKVTAAIEASDAEIDSYCGVRHTVPFTTVPHRVLTLSVDIAIYNLYARRQGGPEHVKERYDNAIAFLKEVAKGKASLGEDDPDAPPLDANAPSISSNTRIFDRDKMSGF